MTVGGAAVAAVSFAVRAELLVQQRLPIGAETAPDEGVAPVDRRSPLDASRVAAGEQHNGGVIPLWILLLCVEPFQLSQHTLGIGRIEFAFHTRLDPL